MGGRGGDKALRNIGQNQGTVTVASVVCGQDRKQDKARPDDESTLMGWVTKTDMKKVISMEEIHFLHVSSANEMP